MMKCPKCDSNLIVTIDGSNNIVKCEKCDYEVVTTYTSPLELDKALYKLIVLVNIGTIDQVKAVSKSLVFNYLESKKILIEGNYTYVTLDSDIKDKKQFLDKANVLYEIEPEFKY